MAAPGDARVGSAYLEVCIKGLSNLQPIILVLNSGMVRGSSRSPRKSRCQRSATASIRRNTDRTDLAQANTDALRRTRVRIGEPIGSMGMCICVACPHRGNLKIWSSDSTALAGANPALSTRIATNFVSMPYPLWSCSHVQAVQFAFVQWLPDERSSRSQHLYGLNLILKPLSKSPSDEPAICRTT